MACISLQRNSDKLTSQTVWIAFLFVLEKGISALGGIEVETGNCCLEPEPGAGKIQSLFDIMGSCSGSAVETPQE